MWPVWIFPAGMGESSTDKYGDRNEPFGLSVPDIRMAGGVMTVVGNMSDTFSYVRLEDERPKKPTKIIRAKARYLTH
jgi:hypothetical protein